MPPPSETDGTIPPPPNLAKRGEYSPPLPTDLRSPCPIINTLANHGYIPRDGLNIRSPDMKSAMSELGVGSTIRAVLTYAAYLEHHPNPSTGFWVFIRNPLAYLLGQFGLRNPGQRDSSGVECLDLNQLSLHGVVEHDVSLSRRDFAQGDSHTSQKDLITALIASSSNGTDLSTNDFITFRQGRLVQQKQDNDKLKFGQRENRLACGEVALVQGVFGQGKGMNNRVPVEYVRALFEEERLPVREGWVSRNWGLGFAELASQASVVRNGVGRIN